MPSNQKPVYAIHGSLIPSGSKMQGNSIDAQVSSFNEKQENPEVKETSQKRPFMETTESTKAIYREKSMSI